MALNATYTFEDCKMKREIGAVDLKVFHDNKACEEKYQKACEDRDEYKFQFLQCKQMYDKKVQEYDTLRQELKSQTDRWALEVQVASLLDELKECKAKVNEYKSMYETQLTEKEAIVRKSLEKFELKVLEAQVASLQEDLRELNNQYEKVKKQCAETERQYSDLLKTKSCPACKVNLDQSTTGPTSEDVIAELRQERVLFNDFKKKHIETMEELSSRNKELEAKCKDLEEKVEESKFENNKLKTEVENIKRTHFPPEIVGHEPGPKKSFIATSPLRKEEIKGKHSSRRRKVRDDDLPPLEIKTSEPPSSPPPLCEAESVKERKLRKRLRIPSEKIAELADEITRLDLKADKGKSKPKRNYRKKKVQDENEPAVDNRPSVMEANSTSVVTRGRRKKAVDNTTHKDENSSSNVSKKPSSRTQRV